MARQERLKRMKNLNKIVIIAALAASFGLANRASAQYQVVGDDSIAASPKVRQMLDQRSEASCCTASTLVASGASVGYQAGTGGIAASPKVRLALTSKQSIGSAPSTAFASPGYQATSADGITASPKVRQQLDEQHVQFMVAPLK
jgi:hypothetical protein